MAQGLGQALIRPYVFKRDYSWPDPNFEPIPHRGKWATLRKCPVPWVLIRARGESVTQRLMVGTPFALDPDTDYEVNFQALPTDLQYSYTTHIRTDRDRSVEIVIDEYPRPGGICRYSAQWITTTTTIGVALVDLCVEGSDVVSVRARSGLAGTDAITVDIYPMETDDTVVNVQPLESLAIAAAGGVYMTYGLGMTLIGNYIQPGMPQYIRLMLAHVQAAGGVCTIVVNQKVMRGWR